ncbi:hypothetical protein [Fundidesulfovibrio putealis]|uniref:hypothetical protein n=1 Tax=Fundidesulfovibrio putealis TaxID=270496 RepID=UPI000683DF49|nr:hypothetical protein [Fundidesulfovibrio putealis]
MPTPKKSRKKSPQAKLATAFVAGIALPVCLAAGWHAAYGQQDVPPASQARPVRATQASLSQDSAGQTASPLPHEELAQMRAIFQQGVRKPTIDRLERTKKMWASAPKIQQILEQRRQRLEQLDQAYFDFARKDVAAQMAKAGLSFSGTQYFAYADRNPQTQFILVGLYDSASDRIEFLGADLISSGNIEKGGDYFVTPTGVFENALENFSYRAMGTPNQDGWRGLGSKDSRVWDFGDQKSLKKYKAGETISQMRLLMHSTDPDKGEPRLGRTDSKGCVRISQGLNKFLDTYAILDRNYEEWAKTRPDSWLLKKDRKPVTYPGRYLIIGDSAPQMQAQAKP